MLYLATRPAQVGSGALRHVRQEEPAVGGAARVRPPLPGGSRANRLPLGGGCVTFLPQDRSEIQRFSQYCATVSSAVVALDIRTHEPELFGGRVVAGSIGDIHVLDVMAKSHAVRRTPDLVANAPARYFKFSLLQRGTGTITQDGRQARLRPGDMAIYETDRPYSLVFDEDVRMSIVMFPRELLHLPPELLGRMTAMRLDSSGGVGAMISPFLGSLTGQITDVGGHVARRLFRTAFDMVETLLESELGRMSIDVAPNGLMMRILDYIDEHLEQPDLDPSAIAAAHFISVRHLHALFRDQGTTVSRVIRIRRLDRCYEALLDPHVSDRSVSTIAHQHGFVELAHFSRIFRSHFGVSPSSLRRDVMAH